MKNNILIFLLGIFVTISIAATVPNTGILTIKPTTPKSTITIECRSYDVQSHITKYSKSGYIFKDFIAGAYYDYDGLLVLEKY